MDGQSATANQHDWQLSGIEHLTLTAIASFLFLAEVAVAFQNSVTILMSSVVYNTRVLWQNCCSFYFSSGLMSHILHEKFHDEIPQNRASARSDMKRTTQCHLQTTPYLPLRGGYLQVKPKMCPREHLKYCRWNLTAAEGGTVIWHGECYCFHCQVGSKHFWGLQMRAKWQQPEEK